MTWTASTHGRVRVLTYWREPDNVIGFRDLQELDDALVAAASDEATNVVVLASSRPGMFIAHADLSDVDQLSAGTVDSYAESAGDPTAPGPEVWGRALARMAEIPQPVVAAVDGQAWGGGFELTLAATLRVASPRAHFRLVEVGDGAIPGAGGTQRLPRLIGPGAAADLVLRGRRVDAGEALRLGLVQAVLAAEPFLDAVLDWVAPMAAAPDYALRAAKTALRAGAELPLAAALDVEQEIFRATLSRRPAGGFGLG